MKSFSKYNLISNEISNLNNIGKKRTFLDIVECFLDKFIDGFSFSIKTPNYLYIRAKVLCDDVYDLSGYSMEVEEIVYLLYRDFLQSVKEYDDPVSIYQMMFLSIESNSKSHIQERFYSVKEDMKSAQYLNVAMKKKDVLRGEIFLRDLESRIPNHGLTVEMVIQSLFNDFLNEYVNGSSQTVISQLIERLEDI